MGNNIYGKSPSVSLEIIRTNAIESNPDKESFIDLKKNNLYPNLNNLINYEKKYFKSIVDISIYLKNKENDNIKLDQFITILIENVKEFTKIINNLFSIVNNSEYPNEEEFNNFKNMLIHDINLKSNSDLDIQLLDIIYGISQCEFAEKLLVNIQVDINMSIEEQNKFICKKIKETYEHMDENEKNTKMWKQKTIEIVKPDKETLERWLE